MTNGNRSRGETGVQPSSLTTTAVVHSNNTLRSAITIAAITSTTDSTSVPIVARIHTKCFGTPTPGPADPPGEEPM